MYKPASEAAGSYTSFKKEKVIHLVCKNIPKNQNNCYKISNHRVERRKRLGQPQCHFMKKSSLL